MNQNWIRRKLGEVLRAALDMPVEHQHGTGTADTGLAMLIDMENVGPAHMDEVMTGATEYGDVIHRSGFGGTTGERWKKTRRKHGILLGRQIQMNAGKNSADMELTIAAMDLLGDRRITGFCIVSSDSDFTPIVMRLREAGKLVVGFGEEKAPAAFVEACDHFETIGRIGHQGTTGAKSAKKPVAQPTKKANGETTTQEPTSGTDSKGKTTVNGRSRRDFLGLVKRAVENAKQHDGWIHTSVVGSQIRKIKPDIRYNDYGHKTLIGILETYPDEIDTRGPKERKQIRLRV